MNKSSTDLYLISDEYTLFVFDILDNNKLVSIFKISRVLPDDNIMIFLGYYDKAEYDSEIMLAMENQLLDITNAARTVNGYSLLIKDEQATSAAREHSWDMADNCYFDHNNLLGQTPFDRMKNQGINYRSAGENIAAGQSDAIYAH